MAQIAIVPFVLKDILLTIGTDNYETNVSTVHFVPNVSAVTWQGLTPASSFSDVTNPTWTCELAYAQDWKTVNSLSQYLLTNAGQSKVAVFKPKGAGSGEAIFTATLIIAPGEIGGDVNTVQTGSVTLGVIGAPVKTANP